MAGLLCLLATSSLLAQEPSAGKFVDATADSGVAEVVSRHYQAAPKWWLSGITLVDLDGDGALDLHLGSHSGTAMPGALAANDGKGRFTYVDPQLSTPGGRGKREELPYPAAEIRLSWDIDEDGKTDLLCTWGDGLGVIYLNGTQRDKWSFRANDAFNPFSRGVALADLNGDGFVDYLTGDNHQKYVAVRLGKGGLAFDKGPELPGYPESGPIAADLDGDGDLDLLVSQRGYAPAKRSILRNDGSMKFSVVTRESGLEEDGGSIHGVGDLNRDGFPDLICVEGAGIEIYFNDGKGRFSRKAGAVTGLEQARSKPKSTNWGGAVVTDFDNDGTADVIVNGRHFCYLLRGTGTGGLAYVNSAWGLTDGASSAVDEGLCFGDVDGDGRLDLVMCGRGPDAKQPGVALYLNRLPAQNWVRVRLVGKAGNRSAAGSTIRIHDSNGLLWQEQVGIWGRQSFHSYYAAAVTERHFGLGTRDSVDVSVEFHPSGARKEIKGVKAGQVLTVRQE